MFKKITSDFFSLPSDRSDIDDSQRGLYRTIHACLTFFPQLLLFITLGEGIIFLLGRVRLLDLIEPRLLIVAGIAALASLLHLPLFPLFRQGKLDLVAILIFVINGAAAVSQVFIWQNLLPLLIPVAVILTLVFATQRGLHRNSRIVSILLGLASIGFLLLAERSLPADRMSAVDNLTLIAAAAILGLVITAMGVLVALNSGVNFRTISGRLVTTFTFVALLSSLAILGIAAIASLYNDRQKVFLELTSASSARTVQVEVTLDNMERDAILTLQDPLVDQRILYILNNKPGSLSYQINYDLVRAWLIRQQTQTSRYREIMLMDGAGHTLISTTDANKGVDFSSFGFFQNVLMGINYAVEFNFPAGFDQTSIMLARPIVVNGFTRGAIVARASFDSIKQILSAKTGVGDTAETYMVALINGNMLPITNTRKNTEVVGIHTRPATMAIMERVNQDSGIWDNYAGKSVLGSYVRIPSLKAVLIAEVEQQEVTQKTINISLINAIIGLFTLLLAFAIVLITSQSISQPVVDMAQKATGLANGELSTRMQVDRQDEIGTLAKSFNSMAGELQIMVRTLEQKVEDRTQDLQKQANYLRVAAEIARDATTAQSLDELLNRAAQLVFDRFGFYHTGIFLLDERKEYAILRASPTAAGQEMLSRNHRLRVGQVGMVGNVAATGISRISLDTGLDNAYFNNPLLPNTRSEMALPLKVGDEMIGVLDVQSDKPEAFTQDDIGILQIMADQLALAIQRVRLTIEQADNLRQLESAYQNFTLSSWNTFTQESDSKQGYNFDGMNITRIDNLPPEIRETISKGRSVVIPSQNEKDTTGSALAVPLKLRDQVIGVLTIQFHTDTVSADTINLVEETASRLAVALENARLYTETQKVAERERAISEVSNRLTTSVNIETILRTTVQEIGRMLPGAEVVVKLEQKPSAAPASTAVREPETR